MKWCLGSGKGGPTSRRDARSMASSGRFSVPRVICAVSLIAASSGVDVGPDDRHRNTVARGAAIDRAIGVPCRSEEHTSELQSLMRISYAVFCLKKKSKQ